MVKYWMTKDAVEAKLVQNPLGHMEMYMEGEKYPFPGHPRGSLLFGKLSPLKHQIKTKIFNEAWRMLEEKAPEHEIRQYLAKTWEEVFALSEETKYDRVPFERLVPPMKELYRAMTKVGVDNRLRDLVIFILQEDDAYRMRFQWIAKFFPKWRKPTVEHMVKGLSMLEHAEIVGDMKERQRLFKRIFLFMACDSYTFKAFIEELNWSKVGLTKADLYFLRAKYFKADYPEEQY